MPSSVTSMYSVQLDPVMTFSVSDMSWAAFALGVAEPLAPLEGLRPSEPQAAEAVTPRPAAPS